MSNPQTVPRVSISYRGRDIEMYRSHVCQREFGENIPWTSERFPGQRTVVEKPPRLKIVTPRCLQVLYRVNFSLLKTLVTTLLTTTIVSCYIWFWSHFQTTSIFFPDFNRFLIHTIYVFSLHGHTIYGGNSLRPVIVMLWPSLTVIYQELYKVTNYVLYLIYLK